MKAILIGAGCIAALLAVPQAGWTVFDPVNDDTDIFLAKYNSAGVHQWSRQFGNSSQNEVRGLDVSSTGLVAITGLTERVSIGGR